ncbi:MAG: RidA family protein [bacterium]
MPREYVKGDEPEGRGYSPAVVTQGGKHVWLAGVTRVEDEEGKSLAGDFEGQAHAIFRQIGRVLERVGGKMEDIVVMTVFILDARFDDRFVGVRKHYFKDKFPGSALIQVAGFDHPDNLLEVQAIAVVGDE